MLSESSFLVVRLINIGLRICAGHPNPPNYNPADWVMNVAQSVSLKELDDIGFFPSDDRDMGEAFEPEEGKDALGITITRRGLSSRSVGGGEWDETPHGFIEQTKLLFLREWRNLQRDVTALGARFGLTVFLSILIGVIFLDVGATDSAIQDNLQSHFGKYGGKGNVEQFSASFSHEK